MSELSVERLKGLWQYFWATQASNRVNLAISGKSFSSKQVIDLCDILSCR